MSGRKIIENPILRTLLRIFVTLSVLFMGTLAFLYLYTRHGQDFLLPDFSGLSVEEAEEMARPMGLKLEVTDSLYMPALPKGAIFRQFPHAGQHVKKNRRVELTVNSIIPRQVAMPSLVGFSLRQAKAELASHGLALGHLSYVPDMATNNVLAQRHNGRPIPPGTFIEILSSIDLELGLAPGHELAYIPMLKGKNLEAAKDIISDHSLNTGSIYYDSSVLTAADTLAARIYRQNPPFSSSPQWPLGTTVHLYLTINPSLLAPEELPIEEENAGDE